MKKKTLALMMAMVLALGAVIGGTIAYFTATTQEVKNTFVMGDIGTLTLEETDSDDADADANNNSYMVVPGQDITKDPTVTYTHPSNNAVPVYVFVKMTYGAGWKTTDNTTFNGKVGKDTAALTFDIASEWTFLENKDGSAVYYKALDAETSLGETSIISGNIITVANRIEAAEDADGLNLDFMAYAIQQNTFDDAAAAWAAVNN